jgi:transcriptional regulator with XRE-family HTH domain
MSLAHTHEQLRSALNYRIQHGTMSGKLLAAQTGIGQSHLSNFLHKKRKLSIDSMDAVMRALKLDVELLPLARAKEQR